MWLIAEAVRVVCGLGFVVAAFVSLSNNDLTPVVSVTALLFLSQITISGLRSQPLPKRESSERVVSRP